MIEPLAVTDEAGRFVLFCKTNTIDLVSATVAAPAAAQRWVTLKPGGDYLVRLQDGVTVSGQVLRQGQPVKGISIAANTTDRICGAYLDFDPVSTDSNGRFLLLNVPPGREFKVSAATNSLPGSGTLPDKIITAGDSDTVQDLGRLGVQP